MGDMEYDALYVHFRVIRSRVTVTAAAARTSISTGTIRPYVHEALQLLEQLSVSPSPERLLQKHSSCMFSIHPA